MSVKILNGDCRDILKDLPAGSVNCCVTSPPYFGLRDYGHDGQIGLEQTPEDFVQQLVEVFREVRRVLKNDGTLWLNLGDSYAGSGKGRMGDGSSNATGKQATSKGTTEGILSKAPIGQSAKDQAVTKGAGEDRCYVYKPKDLMGIPWRVAFALQEDGWYLRQDIIWSKPNPMPESVRDRFTKSHEYIFLFSKSKNYYFDQESVLEPVAISSVDRLQQDIQGQLGSGRVPFKTNGNMKAVSRSGNKARKNGVDRGCPSASGSNVCGSVPWEGEMRNKRDVWTVTTKPFSGAHFAVFPPELIEPCILAGCPQGGVVLDPFGGSGTTGMVSDRHGRNAVLIELNPDYVSLATDRIKSDSPLFADVS